MDGHRKCCGRCHVVTVRLIDARLPDFGVPAHAAGASAHALRRARFAALAKRARARRARCAADLCRPRALRQPRLAHRLRSALRGSAADHRAGRNPDAAGRPRKPRPRAEGDDRGRSAALSAVRPAWGRTAARPRPLRKSCATPASGRPPRRRARLEVFWRRRGRASPRPGSKRRPIIADTLRQIVGARRPRRQRQRAADGQQHRPARHQRDRADRAVRVRRRRGVRGAQGAVPQPPAGHDRVRGGAVDGPRRAPALLPHHALDRRPPVGPRQPIRQGHRARRSADHGGRLLGRPVEPRRLGGRRTRASCRTNARDYVERLATPYFACAAEWYETIGIGVTGGDTRCPGAQAPRRVRSSTSSSIPAT